METPSLRKLYEIIKAKLNSSSNGICITIDNLNLLLNVYGLNNVLSFLQYSQQLIQSKKVLCVYIFLKIKTNLFFTIELCFDCCIT